MTQSPPSTAAERFKISDLVADVASGRIRIPKFQRPLRWDRNNRLELFDSIYRGYPIGTLLFWRREAPEATVQVGSLRIEAPAIADALWVIDGQQRLHTLASALLPIDHYASGQEENILFDIPSEKFITSRRAAPSSRRFPLRGAHETRGTVQWLRDHETNETEYNRVTHLSDRLHNFEVPAYIVNTEEEADLHLIFDRTNTSGKRLKRAEVFHALTTSQLSDASDQPNLERLDVVSNERTFGMIAPDTLLKCELAMRSPDITRDFRAELQRPVKDRIADIERASSALRQTIIFLQTDARVPHCRLLPYQYLLVCLVRFFAHHPEPSAFTRVLLCRWFWRTAAAGPPGRHGHTGFMRQLLAAVSGADAEQTALRLLELVPANGPADLGIDGRFGLNRSQSRIAAAALAALEPIDLMDEKAIDVRVTLDEHGTDSLSRIRRAQAHEDETSSDDETASLRSSAQRGSTPHNLVLQGQTVANRIFVSSQTATAGIGSEMLSDALSRSASQAQTSPSDRLLDSHAIPRDAVEYLEDDRFEQFVLARHELLIATVDSFVESQAEWHQSHRPSVNTLLKAPINR